MSLTSAQLQTLASGIRADATPAIQAALSVRDDFVLAELMNGATDTTAWKTVITPEDTDENTDWTLFDGLTPGKRESWGHFLSRDRDFSRAKVRKWITDVWGNATAGSAAEKLLQSGTEKATKAQLLLGGSNKTTGTVTAFQRDFAGSVSVEEISAALNA